MKLSTALLLPLLALAGGSAAAQSDDVAHERRFYNAWPGSGSLASLAFERAEIGSFGVDTFPDAAVLAVEDGVRRAFQLSNLERFNTIEPLTDGAVDIAVLPDAGNGRDGILVATTSGLKLFRAQPGGVALSCGTCVTTVVSSSAWNAVTRIWVFEAADGSEWIFGYDPTGTLLRLRHSAGVFTAQTSIAAPVGLDELLAMDWGSASEPDLVLWADPIAIVTTWSGTYLTYYDATTATMPAGSKRMVGVSRGDPNGADYERDLLAIYYYLPAAGEFLLFTGNDEVQDLISVGQRACTSMIGVRHDGDALEELVLGSGTAAELHLLRRTGDADLVELSASWGTRIPLVAEAGSPVPPEPPTVIAGTDIDGDGDGDLLAFQPGNEGLQLVHAAHTTGWSPDIRGEKFSLSIENGQGSLDVVLTMPASWPAMGGSSAGPTHVLVEGWLQPDEASSKIDQRALDELVTMPPMPSPYAAPELTIPISWTGTFSEDDFVLHLYCTPVRVVDEVIVRYFPAHFEYFTPDRDVEWSVQEKVYVELHGDPILGNHDIDGDGNVCGTRGGNTPPGDPPSGSGG